MVTLQPNTVNELVQLKSKYEQFGVTKKIPMCACPWYRCKYIRKATIQNIIKHYKRVHTRVPPLTMQQPFIVKFINRNYIGLDCPICLVPCEASAAKHIQEAYRAKSNKLTFLQWVQRLPWQNYTTNLAMKLEEDGNRMNFAPRELINARMLTLSNRNVYGTFRSLIESRFESGEIVWAHDYIPMLGLRNLHLIMPSLSNEAVFLLTTDNIENWLAANPYSQVTRFTIGKYCATTIFRWVDDKYDDQIMDLVTAHFGNVPTVPTTFFK